MNILFDINHPAHVHLFRNAIKVLESNGHRVTVTSRDKDVTLALLNAYRIKHTVLSKARKGLFHLGLELVIRQARLWPVLRRDKIHVCVSATGACSVHVCGLLGIPSLVFYDTEHAKLQNALTVPFATRFITPRSFRTRFGKNHITYNGVHDLAYVHPKYFTPDYSISTLLGLTGNEPYVIMRFVSWEAAHDIGRDRMTLTLKKKLVGLCAKHMKVFIVSEAPLGNDFEPYRLTVPPEKALDVLNRATLYIGDGGSMATEAALLGTPAIFVSSLTAGVFDELEHRGLMLTFTPDQEEAIYKTIERLLNENDLKRKWGLKRQACLDEMVNLTDFMVGMIMQYAPEGKE